MNVKKNILLILFVFSSFSLSAQNWDYEKYPALQVDLTHMDAGIRITQEGFIEGDIRYRGTMRQSRTDSIKLHAIGMNIISVAVNGQNKDYRADDDRIVIMLNQSLLRNQTVNIHIRYDTEPGFGVHKNSNGTAWTSLLPKSTRHWLPVIDHPRVAFTFEIAFTHPSGNRMVASGRRGSSELISVDEEVTVFSSNRPVPASALSWALGSFRNVNSTTEQDASFPAFQRRSDPQIYLYSESESHNNQELLRNAGDSFQRVQRELGAEFPFRDLHIVILEEEFWETKNYGAGVIFVTENGEDINFQIQKGILAQWIGTHIREEQWSDASAILLLQALYANRLFNFEIQPDSDTEPYHMFSNNKLIAWQNFLLSESSGLFTDDAVLTASDILSRSGQTLSWYDFAKLIYDKTGQPYFSGFEPSVPTIRSTTDSYDYAARIVWEEGSGTAEIYFEALGSPVDELVTVRVTEVTFTGARTHEVTFSGQSDGMVINVTGGIENLVLHIDSRDDIMLHVEKPYLFWVHQLRNDDNPVRRADAARGLSHYTDNPDLQLALNDLLQSETDSDVISEIVRSISRLTAGAAGTDERFIQLTSAQQPASVQLAATEALSSFRNNERVISRLRTIVIQTSNREIRREAIYSLSEVADATRFQGFVTDFVTRENILGEVPLLLQLLAESGNAEAAVDIASTFISEEFPFDIRYKALDVILEFDQSPANWNNRLPDLLKDRHPRIRFKAAQALGRLNLQQRRQIVDSRIDDEYDERVRRQLR